MNKIKRELSKDPILLRIIELLQKQNKTQKELMDYLGIHQNTFNNWKYANSKSFMKRINEIADYLNVTSDYLIAGDKAKPSDITPIQEKIIIETKKLSLEQQSTLLSFLKSLTSTNNPLR